MLAHYHAPMARTGIVELPLHLKWSGPTTYDLDDPQHLRVVYEVVLQEGNAADVREYIDPDVLLALWDDMFLPVGVRRAWRDWFARHRGIQVT